MAGSSHIRWGNMDANVGLLTGLFGSDVFSYYLHTAPPTHHHTPQTTLKHLCILMGSVAREYGPNGVKNVLISVARHS